VETPLETALGKTTGLACRVGQRCALNRILCLSKLLFFFSFFFFLIIDI